MIQRLNLDSKYFHAKSSRNLVTDAKNVFYSKNFNFASRILYFYEDQATWSNGELAHSFAFFVL